VLKRHLDEHAASATGDGTSIVESGGGSRSDCGISVDAKAQVNAEADVHSSKYSGKGCGVGGRAPACDASAPAVAPCKAGAEQSCAAAALRGDAKCGSLDDEPEGAKAG
jgi:hypothetical protein